MGRGLLANENFPKAGMQYVLKAIAQTLHTPQWVKDPANEFGPTIFGAEIDGVQIEVKAFLYQGRYVIERAYPVGGEGVIMNMENGDKIEIKKSRAKVWIGA